MSYWTFLAASLALVTGLAAEGRATRLIVPLTAREALSLETLAADAAELPTLPSVALGATARVHSKGAELPKVLVASKA